MFPPLLRRDINLHAVQDKWAVNGGVIMFILHMYKILVEKKAPNIDKNDFATTFMFQ
jgi:hypothetical protein